MKQKARATVSKSNHDGAPPVARHTHKARPTPPHSSHLSASRRRRMDSAHRTTSKRRPRRWRDRAPRRHTRNARTQVHAAFDVQDTEAWSNADDLRTPSEVKAELARLRQLALACVTAKMDNKKVNDKIDLNARARRPFVSMRLVGGFFFAEEALPRRRPRRPPSTRLPS